jgi:hypothetical protein
LESVSSILLNILLLFKKWYITKEIDDTEDDISWDNSDLAPLIYKVT